MKRFKPNTFLLAHSLSIAIWSVGLAQERSEIRVERNKNEKSSISLPAGLELEQVSFGFQFLNPRNEPLAGSTWTGDALIDYQATADISGKWKSKAPRAASNRMIKLKLVVDLESYCSLDKYLARARAKKWDPGKITGVQVKSIINEIGDMQVKVFDTVVIDLEFEVPAEVGKGTKLQPAELMLPHAFSDKKQRTLYRLKTRSDSKRRIVTANPGFFYTYGKIKPRRPALPKFDR